MRRLCLFPTTVALLALALPVLASAQLAQSTFAGGAEGWLSVTLPYPSAVPPDILGTYGPVWIGADGGYLSIADPDGSGAGNTEYWQAPAAFLGARGAAYGGTLSFDLANAGSGFGTFAQEDLILLGGGVTLVRALPAMPGPAFMHFAIPMTEDGWRRDGLAGLPASAAEFQAALANLTHLFIRAEFQLGPDTEYLDNVVLAAPVSAVDLPPGDGFALGRCAPNPFNPSTVIPLTVDRAAVIRVDVLDARGRIVRKLRDEAMAPGNYAITWDGRDDGGLRAASGVYFCRAGSAADVVMSRMVLLK